MEPSLQIAKVVRPSRMLKAPPLRLFTQINVLSRCGAATRFDCGEPRSRRVKCTARSARHGEKLALPILEKLDTRSASSNVLTRWFVGDLRCCSSECARVPAPRLAASAGRSSQRKAKAEGVSESEY